MTTMRGKILMGVLAFVAAGAMPARAQITTGAVTGVVKDTQAGVIPGATVVLISETQGTRTAPATTNAQGSYTIPTLKADKYTVEVSLGGFKTYTRSGILVSGGDRVVVQAVTLELGTQSETVEVRAEAAPVIQAATGERSTVLETQQLDNLPVSNHGFFSFITVQQGVDQSQTGGSQARRVGGGGQDNVMIDGLSALDTGNNGLMSGMNVPAEAISEVKVLTSSYQAEYGRSSGLQVSAVTRGGTNRFHGAVYDYERNSDWNANSWTNVRNGNPKTVSKQRDWGFVIGGPVGKPGGSDNKLFFFFTQEYQPRQAGNNTYNYRLPTALERQGDFSQTLDNNGNRYNLIRDASTGLPCTASNTGGCFQAGGVLGRIPLNRLYGPGMALLSMYPMPNGTQTAGSSYNDSEQLPIQNQLSYTPVTRIDYQATQNLRATWKIAAASARVVPGWTVNGGQGNLPREDFSKTIQKFPLSFNMSGTVNYTLNPTTFIEATYGVNQNRLGNPAIGPYSNRNNIGCSASLAAQVANCTGAGIPFLFPDAGIVNPAYYEYGALGQVGTPFFQNGTILMPPQLSWGSTRLSNPPPSMNYPGWLNINRIQQFSGSVTKVAGRHTVKGGLYYEHSYKAQNTGGNDFQGKLNFGVNTSNPLDSTFPYANEALGIFNTYSQGSKFIEGNFFYNNVEGYLQDNWKVSRKLTLDYGVRFAHDGPYTDNLKQVSNFFPDKWSAAAAPLLYQPGCVSVSPCSGNNRQARDPRTGALLGPGTSSLIGAVIVGTGDFANGMVQAGNGISDAGYTWPSLAVAPRFGAAYDISGNQHMVLRGAVGLYFDRPDGNTAFGTVANPPVATGLTQQWGMLADLANPTLAFGPVPNISANQYDSAIPKDVQWNAGMQVALPWSSSVDVSYVGHHAYDVLANTQNGNSVNINTIDLGTTFTAAGQDPTQAPGTALSNNLLRRFAGYGNINIQEPIFDRTFHSLQTSFTRRFSHGISFGVNWTWSIYDKGSTRMPGGNPQLRLDHNADGTFSVRADQATAVDLFGDQGTRRHIVTANYVWDLPDLQPKNTAKRVVGLVINDWQLSGIFSADSGTPYDLSYSYNTGPTGTALTGSPDYAARIVLTNLGALGSGCSDNQYAQIGNTMVAATSGTSPVVSTALAGPQVGSVGLESGRYYLTGCGNHILDTAIQRNIKLGGGRQLEFRADVFNTFNTVIFTSRSTQLQMNSVTDQTVRNSQFLANGQVDPNRLTPNRAGFGAVTGAAALRSVQGQIRFRF